MGVFAKLAGTITSFSQIGNTAGPGINSAANKSGR